MRALLATLVASLLATITLFGQTTEDPWAKVGVGDRVPQFEATMTDGTTISSADLQGRVVLLTLWASWCPSCRKEFKWLHRSEEFAALLDNPQFLFLPVAREENSATVEAWMTKKGYNFRSAADPERELYSLFAEQEIPRNILIDSRGIVRYHSSSYSSKSLSALVAAIGSLLNESSAGDADAESGPLKETERQ